MRVEAKINPTEDQEKVKRAITNIISNLTFETVPEGYAIILTAKGEGKDALSPFYYLLRKEKILDTARGILFKGIDGDRILFYLNKQVAFVKKISFCKPFAESPLGPLKVEIICGDPEEFINWLSPKTSR